MSKFIKNMMVIGLPLDVMQGKTGGIDILYTNTNIYLLVYLRNDGMIVLVRPIERQRKDSTWSISTTEAGIMVNDTDKFTSKDALLCSAHIIVLNKDADGHHLSKINN